MAHGMGHCNLEVATVGRPFRSTGSSILDLECGDRAFWRREVFTLTDTHRQDFDRRLERYREKPKAGSPWEEVKARLQGKTD